MTKIQQPEKLLPEVISTNIISESPNSIKELDIDRLRSEMMAGMYSLESSLYKQATLENTRLEKLRSSIGMLEENIFSKEFIDELSDKSKVILYKIASENVQSIMNFLLQLHKTIEGGVGVLSQIQNMKESQKSEDKKDSTDNKEITKTIQDLIKSKIKERITKK